MVDVIKNNAKTIIAVIVVIIAVCVVVVTLQPSETEISKGHTETTVTVHDSTHIRDSIALAELQFKYDSLYKSTRVTVSNEKDTKDEKRGVMETTTTTEKTNKDGSKEVTTTTTKIDTTRIISVHIKSVIDSMTKLIEVKIDSAKKTVVAQRETITVHDTTIKTVHDTLYKHVITAPKKLSLAAQAGVVASGKPNVNPMIDLDARYNIWGPVFVDGGVGYIGMPTNYLTSSNYKVHVGAGVKFDF